MSNTSNLQKTGMQMLLGRERFETLMAEADRVGLSMATVVRAGIDAWLAVPQDQRRYEGELRPRRVVDVAAREKAPAAGATEAAAAPHAESAGVDPSLVGPLLADALRRANHPHSRG